MLGLHLFVQSIYLGTLMVPDWDEFLENSDYPPPLSFIKFEKKMSNTDTNFRLMTDCPFVEKTC